jgi:exodeoxyribonuclease-3
VTVRFMTWNIKTGGGSRRPAILAVLARERPDVLALQELRGFEHHIGTFAGSVGMTAHLARSAFGQPVAVLVRPPITITGRREVRWRLHHAAAIAKLSTPAGPMTVISTHLNPFSPYRRMREARWLAARYGSRRDLVLLAGDLNGLAPGTDHTAEIDALPDLYQRRHRARDGTPDTRALQAFHDFTDLWVTTGTGDGRTAPTTQGGGKEFSGMRLDYILASPPAAQLARHARVIRGDETEYASDHYPLTVELTNSRSPGAR